MSRKTYSLSAAAVVAITGLSFSSADGAVAIAQEAEEQLSEDQLTAAPVETAIEIVPEQTRFVASAVVQDVPDPTEIEEAETPKTASSLRELVQKVDRVSPLSEQMQCLAGAVYFEARGEPLAGQLAVAQVVINRSEDRRWPASYCGVVYQRSQFSFVRGGRMPSINTSSGAWTRAKAVARIAHQGLWESEAADAVYFHANYVRPRWSRSKTRLTQIDTHVFYR